MNIAQLAQTIRDDASRQAHEYESETRAMVERIDEETTRLVAQRREELRRAASLRAQAQRARLQAQQEIEARMRTLQQRKEVLDAVFARAAKELGALQGWRRTRLLTRLWSQASAMHSPTVIVANKDAPFFTKRAHVTRREPGLGGFIAVSADSKERLDLRFETLLQEARPKVTPDIARILWGATPGSQRTNGKRTITKKAGRKRASPIKRSAKKATKNATRRKR